MQWIHADIVFDGYDFYTNLYLQVNHTGEIVRRQYTAPQAELRHYTGMLMPGMINAHCHLELSAYKYRFEKHTGLPLFLQNVNKQHAAPLSMPILTEAMQQAEKEMLQHGIVAVGDICNTTNSIAVKKKSNIHYHNFIECIAIRAADTQKRFAEYLAVLQQFEEVDLAASLALHAPYTCNAGLYELVNKQSNFISIHNQESEAEVFLFDKKPSAFDDFYKQYGLDKIDIIKAETSNSSVVNSLRLLSANTKKLFVHNTFTPAADIAAADENTWWCFCPNANLYIENCLPNIPNFLHTNNIVLGTDSLASNNALNILAEVKTLHDAFPKLPLPTILQWATSNGAKLLGLDKTFGSFEVGKSPGFVLVPDIALDSHGVGTLSSATCERIFMY